MVGVESAAVVEYRTQLDCASNYLGGNHVLGVAGTRSIRAGCSTPDITLACRVASKGRKYNHDEQPIV